MSPPISRRRVRAGVLLAWAIVVLVASSGAPLLSRDLRSARAERSGRGVAFPTYEEREAPDAVIRGRLTVERRCLVLSRAQRRPLLLLWPDRMKLAAGPRGVGVKANGEVLARRGDDVRAGGGRVSRRTGDRLAAVPPRCESFPYWITASIRRT